MQAGALRHRIIFQEDTPTQNDTGESVSAWSTWATVWAEVSPLSGRERFQNVEAQKLAQVDYRIRIRARPDVSPAMRVLWGSRTFKIHAVTETEEKGREILLLCEEQPT